MNNKSVSIFIITIILALGVITAISVVAKPDINKTMVLQIQKYVKP